MFLHLCVILFRGGVSQSLRQRPPLDREPSQTETPLDRNPPWTETPPYSKERAVGILLEWILVFRVNAINAPFFNGSCM